MKLMLWFPAIVLSLSGVASAQTNEVEIKKAIENVNLDRSYTRQKVLTSLILKQPRSSS
jgi:hypothetical protein